MPEQKDDSFVKIGKKPVMSYVTASIRSLEKVKEITIQARGKNIARAVDAVEILKNQFKCTSGNIKIGTDELKPEGSNQSIRISTIEIVVRK